MKNLSLIEVSITTYSGADFYRKFFAGKVKVKMKRSPNIVVKFLKFEGTKNSFSSFMYTIHEGNSQSTKKNCQYKKQFSSNVILFKNSIFLKLFR
jgi:hypothetical protein